MVRTILKRYIKNLFMKGSIENIKRVNHLYISRQKYHFGTEKQHIFECPQKGSKVIFGFTEIGLTIASFRQVQGQNKKWQTHHTWSEVEGNSDFFQLTQDGIQYDGKIIFKGLIPYKAEEDGIAQFQLLPVRFNDNWINGTQFNGFVEHQQKAKSPVLGFKLHLRQDSKYGYIDTAVFPLVGYKSWTTNKKQFYQQQKEDFPAMQK